MSHFYVGQTEDTPWFLSSPSSAPLPPVDPLMALSEAFRKAIASDEMSHNNTNAQKTNIEARQNGQNIQDSIVWTGQPSLLSMLSNIADQVCVIDSGAGARLIDTILGALPVNSMGITSIITSIAESSSVSATDLLPLVLPAIAAALGKHVQQPRIADSRNVDGIMANIIWQGGLFVGEIINSETYLASTELYDVLNQVAGLMCTAADHLTLPICVISKIISGTTYQIVIPCDCTGSTLPPAASQPPESYMPDKTTTAMDWSVMTMPPTAGYSFSSLSPTNLPPKYGKGTPDYTTNAPVHDVSAQPIQSHGQQPQTSCTLTLPPAYSSLSREI